MSKRAKIITSVVVLVAVLAVAGTMLLQAQGGGPEIETATATEQNLAVTVTASGKVEAGVSADVFPPAAATIDTIYVSDGETVTAGDRIALLDSEPLELQVAQARAALSAAKAQLANVGATGGGAADIKAACTQVDAAERSVTAAKSGQVAAQTGYNNASSAYSQAVAVLPSDSPTLSALALARDQAKAGLDQAKAGVTQARAALDGAKAALARAKAGDPASQKRAAQQGVQQAAAALALAEDALDKSTMTAPIDGIVIFNAPGAALGGGTKATEGSAVSPQAAPFTVVDLSALRFTAEVDEADIDRVKVDMKAMVSLDAFPGEEFSSVVTRINPAAQPTATGGTVFAVELDLGGVAKDILLGMKGDADVEVSSRGSALTVPVEALFSEGGTDFVYSVVAGKLKKTEITVGATTDTDVEVLSGLQAGDTVALSGSTQYVDGMPVREKQ